MGKGESKMAKTILPYFMEDPLVRIFRAQNISLIQMYVLCLCKYVCWLLGNAFGERKMNPLSEKWQAHSDEQEQ